MKTLRMLFGIFVLVAAVYVGYHLFTPYFNNYQFQDAVETEARMNTYSSVRKSDEEIRDGLLKKAEELDVPVTRDQIRIDRRGREYIITADYTVHVELPVYPVDLNFHNASKK